MPGTDTFALRVPAAAVVASHDQIPLVALVPSVQPVGEPDPLSKLPLEGRDTTGVAVRVGVRVGVLVDDGVGVRVAVRVGVRVRVGVGSPNVAVYAVSATGVETSCVAAPPSDQETNP